MVLGAPISDEREASPYELQSALERHRGRARSLASLAATAAGAMIAGLAFTPSADNLRIASRWFGLAAAVLLALGVVALCVATIVTRAPKSVDEPPAETDRRALKTVRNWTVCGGISAVLGLGCSLAVAVTESLPGDTQRDTSVAVLLESSAARELTALCPAGDNPARGLIVASSASLLEVSFLPGECVHGRAVNVQLDRSTVRAILYG